MAVSIDYTKTRGGIYPGWRSIHSDFSSQAWTGDTNENTVKSKVVPAGHGLYAGCRILITSHAQAAANNANAKTFRVKIGNQSFASPSLASTLSIRRTTEILLVSLTSQKFFPSGSQTGYGVTGSAIATASVDLSGSFTISTSVTLGNASDTVTDEGFTVEFWYAP